MNLIYLAADLVLILILALVLYRPRHGRKDLVIAFIGANVGVFVVAGSLSNVSTSASLGVGLGLFGVLSIIRLRSTEIEQHDVAYFFSALAMGLVAGLAASEWWITAGLMALPVVALAIFDSRVFMSRSRRGQFVTERAIWNESELRTYLSDLLEAEITQLKVVCVDLVQDKTIVDVSYRVAAQTRATVSRKARSESREESPERGLVGSFQ